MLGAIGLLVGIGIHFLAVLAGVGLAILMIGAISMHLSRRDSLSHTAAPVVFLVMLAVVIVLQWSTLGGKVA